jgi:hypothetical protein
MRRFIFAGIFASVSMSGFVSPVKAEAWQSTNVGLCRFKASADKVAELTKEIDFQFKSSLKDGDELNGDNFRLHDPDGLLKGSVLRQMGFNGQAMSLVSRSEASKPGDSVIGLIITISNPPQEYNHAAIISGALGEPKSRDTLYVGMCSLQQVEAGADLMWQAAIEKASKS